MGGKGVASGLPRRGSLLRGGARGTAMLRPYKGISEPLRGRAAGDRLLDRLGRKQGGHFADHRQDQALVTVGKRGGVLLDFRKEANFVLREFTQRFLCFAVAGRLCTGEKVGERNVHGLGDFGKGFERRHGVAVFDARKVAAQQARAALDISLRKAALAAIALDDFPDVHSRLFFWHGHST